MENKNKSLSQPSNINLTNREDSNLENNIYEEIVLD